MEDRFATNNASFRSSTYPSRARKAFLTRRKSGPLNISIVDLACPSFGTLPVQKQQQQQQQGSEEWKRVANVFRKTFTEQGLLWTIDSSPGQSGSKRAPQGKLRRDTGKHNVMPTSLKSLKSMRTLDSSVLYQLRVSFSYSVHQKHEQLKSGFPS